MNLLTNVTLHLSTVPPWGIYMCSAVKQWYDKALCIQAYMSAVAQPVQPIKFSHVFLHGQNVNQSCLPNTGE